MCVIHIHWHVYINIICIWHINIYIIYIYIYIPLYTHISYIYIYHIHRTHRDTLICWLLVKYQLPENLGWFWWLDQLHVLTELKVRVSGDSHEDRLLWRSWERRRCPAVQLCVQPASVFWAWISWEQWRWRIKQNTTVFFGWCKIIQFFKQCVPIIYITISLFNNTYIRLQRHPRHGHGTPIAQGCGCIPIVPRFRVRFRPWHQWEYTGDILQWWIYQPWGYDYEPNHNGIIVV